MPGEAERQATLMLGLTPDGFVPKDHPLRQIKPLVYSALARMSPLFDELYAAGGRPSTIGSVPPHHPIRPFFSSLLILGGDSQRVATRSALDTRGDGGG